jgi:hypothetical protein
MDDEIARMMHANQTRTPEDERADVLAFLARAVKYPFPYPAMSVYRYIETLADLIRRGDHVGAAKEKKP